MKIKISLYLVIFLTPFCVLADSADHVVISEIKITGGTGKTTDEFVELYNPTEQDISLSGWSLIKKTASGSEYELVQDFGELTINPNSYLLIAHPTGYLGEVVPDMVYTSGSSLASNNSILLNDEVGVVDLVGLGSSLEFESDTTSNPGTNKSIERKALADSDEDSMLMGEVDSLQGNGYDSDDNSFDFIPRTDPDPQNSQSDKEFIGNIITNTNEQSKVYSDQIMITEIFPNPEGSDNEEFIELYNSGSKEIDLSGWKLGDNSTNRHELSGILLSPGRYLVVDKEITGISLNNTGDSAKLFDPNGEVKSSVEYASCQEAMSYAFVDNSWQWTSSITPGQENKLVIDNQPPEAFFELENSTFMVGEEITLDGSESSDPDGDDLQFSWLIDDQELTGEKVKYTFKNKGELNIKLTVVDIWEESSQFSIKLDIIDYDYSNKIIISELLPSCEGPDADCEYIELFNMDERSINLYGWSLTDTKKTFVFDDELMIGPGDYLFIKKEISGITLNNDEDKVYLIDPGGDIISGVEYFEAKNDQSFSIFDGNWHWTSEPTPGDENIIIGEKVEAETEDEIDIMPIEVAIKDVSEEFLDKIIIVSGEVESANKRGIYLMDEAGNTIRIYIQEKTNIPWPEVSEGDFMQVTGLLDKTSAGLRLLPQVGEDIFITKKSIESDEDNSKPQVLGTSIDKQELEVLPNNNNLQIVKYLYAIIGILAVAVVGVSIKYFSTKKSTQDLDEDIY